MFDQSNIFVMNDDAISGQLLHRCR